MGGVLFPAVIGGLAKKLGLLVSTAVPSAVVPSSATPAPSAITILSAPALVTETTLGGLRWRRAHGGKGECQETKNCC